MKRSLLIIVIIAAVVQGAGAQQFKFSDYVPKSPKSPNAAALGQYGDIPVSLYTGVPNIQIPIYEIKVGGFSMPISLSYHASGVKVEDYPSWVGTGWVLNAGGVISRQQRGINDERMIDNYAAFQQQATTILNSPIQNSLGLGDQAPTGSSNDMYDRNFDTESDVFNCILPNGNSKFYLDVAGKAHLIPASKLQIEPFGRTIPSASARIYCFNQWVVTDNDGTKYIYGLANNVNTYEVVTPENYNTTEILPESIINSWYLAEIDLTNGQKINFNYETYSYSTPTSPDITVFYDSRVVQSISSGQLNYLNFTVARRLSNITFPGGKVDFIAGGNRADIPTDKVLDRINIYNQSNNTYNLLKTYKIVTNNLQNVSPVPLNDLSNSFRLNLQAVEMYDAIQSKIGTYTLNYDLTSPSVPRNGLIDYWGYYRGNAVDPLTYISPGSDTYKKLNGTPGRPANPDYTQFDILKQITYPTGGYSKFTYENNRAVPNDPSILSFIGNLTDNFVPRTMEYDLPNDATRSATGFSPEFTVGHVEDNARFQFTLHELANDGVPCAVLTQCFSNNLWRKNADGSWTNLGGVNADIKSNTTYKIQIVWHASNQGVAYATYTWLESPAVSSAVRPTFNVGGVRIKNIQSFDPVTNSSVNKYYEYNNDAGESSGVIAALPVYSYIYPLVYEYNVNFPNVFTTTSKNQSSLFGGSGAEVGYSTVTEYTDVSGTLGKTVYKYTSNDTLIPGGYADQGIYESFVWPFPPATSFDWRRGNLLSKYTYVKRDGVYQPVSKIDNTYQFFGSSDLNYQSNTNIKIFQSEIVFLEPPVNDIIYAHDYLKYNTVSEAYFNSSSTEQIFDSQNNVTSTTKSTTNVFDHVSLENNSSTILKSNGGSNIQEIQYAIDYNTSVAGDDAALGIKNLITSNQVKAPVEQLNIIQSPSGQSYVTKGALFLYYKDKPLIKDYFNLKLLTPVLLSSFVQSSINSSGQFIYDSRYELNSSSAYTPGYNINQFTERGIKSTAYQWGYNEQYTVAQAMNAKNNDIFYDSFEEGDGNSILDDSKTGHYSYTGAYSKSLTGLDAGTYILSYWQKSGSLWSLTNTPLIITGSTYTINLNVQIDDVRFYPSDAEMTTYTYDPLVGMTSSTDAKGKTTYYKYDNAQRLMNIKDQDKNIVKGIDYHYSGQ